MVTTRLHPDANFPSTPTSTSSTRSPSSSTSNSQTLTRRSKSTSHRSTSKPSASSSRWTHTPSNLTLLWLAISLPLVIWDTGYVLLRPHSMPGGKWHKPIWSPYELYGTIDYVYGFPALEAKLGFTGAQASLNVVETIGYAIYLWMVYTRGVEVRNKGRGAPKKLGRAAQVADSVKRLANARVLSGRSAVVAVVLAYSMALLTVGKTVLYALNEAFSGFSSVGHNPALRLLFLWILPNGAWLVLPTYMLYVFGSEILEGLEVAAS